MISKELEEFVERHRKEWYEQQNRDLEKLIWSGTTWENSNATPKTNNMTTLYTTDNVHLRKALIKELKELGYKDFDADPFLQIYTKNNEVGGCLLGSIRADEATKTFNLKTEWNEALEHATKHIEPKFEVGDWVYIKNNHSVREVVGVREQDGWLALKGEYMKRNDREYNYHNPDKRHLRKATPDEIEQAKPKTFFDWKVNKFENETTIGCQTFNDDFLQELTEAIYNLEGDVSIRELQDELYNIGFKSEREDLPF